MPTYRPHHQSIFLSDDLHTINWSPFQASTDNPASIPEQVKSFHDNVHAYFISSEASHESAAAKDRIKIYRHIGHVVLEIFHLNYPIPEKEGCLRDLSNSMTSYVNMRMPITRAVSPNGSLIQSLMWLASPEVNSQKPPAIVLVARREDLLTTGADNTDTSDIIRLAVQVYIGRPFFNLVSNTRVRALLAALRPSSNPTPTAEMPPCRDVFSRSPPAQNGYGSSYARILRDSESLGYTHLTPKDRKKINRTLTVKLYRFQEQTVRWMLDKENSSYVLNDYFWEEWSFTDTPHCQNCKFYFFPLTCELRLTKPPSIRGGLVAEDFGLGKSAEALALIAAQKSPHRPVNLDVMCDQTPPHVTFRDGIVHLSCRRTRNLERSHPQCSEFHHGDEIIDQRETFDYPTSVCVRRWPARTTLIVCPKTLLNQWKLEVHKLAPSLSLEIWSPATKRDHGTPLSVAVGENARDIVLATYDMVRADRTLAKISWKRLILDESHVVRSPTQITNISNFRCKTRFLLTANPMSSFVNDLKSQLAILKIWPFSLEQDKAWNSFVLVPFRLCCAIPTLRALLDVVMIRHSRAQQLSLPLPSRLYETIKVPLEGSYRACYYFVLATCLEEKQYLNFGDPSRLNTILKSLFGLCLSPYLLDYSSLNSFRQVAWCKIRGVSTTIRALQKVSAQEAILFMAESCSETVDMSNRDTVIRPEVLNTAVEPFIRLPIAELQNLVVNRSLLSRVRAQSSSRERLAALAAGGVHRLRSDSLAELRATAIRLRLGSVQEVMVWSRERAASSLELHYRAQDERQSIHNVPKSGLCAILKLIERQGCPNCPICLTDCTGRITATRCGHLYCHECMTLLLGLDAHQEVRCAICRRHLTPDAVVEILSDQSATGPSAVEREFGTDDITILLNERGQAISWPSEASSSGGSPVTDENLKVEEGESKEIILSPKTAWEEFERINSVVGNFDSIESIGRDERLPFLCPEFLRHLLVARRGSLVPPKFAALRTLILSYDPKVKFCVVAGCTQSLREIAMFLESVGIAYVGACTSPKRNSKSAVERFTDDPSIRVYLLDPGNSSGQTLTAASVVVFMETLLRMRDEFQAISRVHRIGQTQPVKVVRIAAKDTLEESVVESRGKFSTESLESQALMSQCDDRNLDNFFFQLFCRR